MTDEPQDHDLTGDDVLDELGFVLVKDTRPPPRIAMARERLLMSRLYVGLIRSLNDDYGAAFVHSDSATLRSIGIYVFLKTAMCSPARTAAIAHALNLPKPVVNKRLQDLLKLGYVERVGNAYRVTDKVNIPDLQDRLQRRIDMILATARELAKLRASQGKGDAQEAA